MGFCFLPSMTSPSVAAVPPTQRRRRRGVGGGGWGTGSGGRGQTPDRYRLADNLVVDRLRARNGSDSLSLSLSETTSSTTTTTTMSTKNKKSNEICFSAESLAPNRRCGGQRRHRSTAVGGEPKQQKKGNKTGFLLGFYRVSIDLTGLEWVQTGFLPYWTRFEQVFTEFYWV